MESNELAKYREDAELIALRKQRAKIEWEILRLGDKERQIFKELNIDRGKLKSRLSVLETHINKLESEKS